MSLNFNAHKVYLLLMYKLKLYLIFSINQLSLINIKLYETIILSPKNDNLHMQYFRMLKL